MKAPPAKSVPSSFTAREVAAKFIPDPRVDHELPFQQAILLAINPPAFTKYPAANKIPWTWELTETEKEDLSELYAFYKYRSGGLMLKALNLFPTNGNINELSYKFNEIGLRRERHLFSLKKEKVLKAVIMINVSDFGLNLSDLTNSITVFIVDDEELPYKIISTVNSLMSEKLSMGDIPIMIYPVEYLNLQNVSFDKIYNLWVLSSDYTDNYFRYLKRLLKFIQH